MWLHSLCRSCYPSLQRCWWGGNRFELHGCAFLYVRQNIMCESRRQVWSESCDCWLVIPDWLVCNVLDYLYTSWSHCKCKLFFFFQWFLISPLPLPLTSAQPEAVLSGHPSLSGSHSGSVLLFASARMKFGERPDQTSSSLGGAKQTAWCHQGSLKSGEEQAWGGGGGGGGGGWGLVMLHDTLLGKKTKTNPRHTSSLCTSILSFWFGSLSYFVRNMPTFVLWT